MKERIKPEKVIELMNDGHSQVGIARLYGVTPNI